MSRETEAKGDAAEAKASNPDRLGGEDDRLDASPNFGAEDVEGVDEADEALDEDANTLPLTEANGELVDAYAIKPLWEIQSECYIDNENQRTYQFWNLG